MSRGACIPFAIAIAGPIMELPRYISYVVASLSLFLDTIIDICRISETESCRC
jgi:hypothetical protein